MKCGCTRSPTSPYFAGAAARLRTFPKVPEDASSSLESLAEQAIAAGTPADTLVALAAVSPGVFGYGGDGPSRIVSIILDKGPVNRAHEVALQFRTATPSGPR